MQVFIAEGNYYELERLRRQVQSWGSRHGGVSITAVQCVAEVGPADLRTYDAVFLDVELPGKDGFAFAQELRGAGCSADIVFVTNHPELSLKGYTVHAQDYIIKPVEQERIDAAMDYIARNCRLKERQEHRAAARYFPAGQILPHRNTVCGGKQPQQHRLYIR